MVLWLVNRYNLPTIVLDDAMVMVKQAMDMNAFERSAYKGVVCAAVHICCAQIHRALPLETITKDSLFSSALNRAKRAKQWFLSNAIKDPAQAKENLLDVSPYNPSVL